MLENRIIVVTGGLGRLGSAIVERVEAGGGVAVPTTRDERRAAAFDAEARSRGTRSRARVLGFDDEGAMAAFVDAVLEEFGSLDGLVNNAYPALPFMDVESVDWAHWMESARIGLGAALSLSRAVVARRERSRVESIVNIGSIYGESAPDFSIYPEGMDPNPVYYGAMKAGLVQMTRYLAVYWARLGVRVNAVSPGGILAGQDPEFLARYGARVPTGRMVTREEVANAVCFLLGPGSSGITGVNLPVDAGRGSF